MTNFSSFDPLFWLHHAYVFERDLLPTRAYLNCSNLDRVFALWQVLHPDSYVSDPMSQDESTRSTLKQGAELGLALEPFFTADGRNFHNPMTVRDWSSFGYSYPELGNSEMKLSVRKARVLSILRAKYGYQSERQVE